MEDNIVEVKLWGQSVGLVSWDKKLGAALFQYSPEFIRSGLDIAPTTMPVNAERSRKNIPWIGERDKLFQGLPSMLADSLPDHWGESIFRRWLIEQKIPVSSVNAVDRLSYIGSRGMGALEYEPARNLGKEDFSIDVNRLYDFTREILDERKTVRLNENDRLLWQDMIKVGTSAGGKRPKALVALNPDTGEVRSGQAEAPEGFIHYILKFGETAGEYPAAKIEYIYWRIATEAGITMTPSHLKEYDGVTHFLTERFDREGNEKLHMQTVAAMKPLATDYDDIFSLLRELNLPYGQHEQLYRIMVFNALAKNVDDHNKNFSLLMDKNGLWRFAPAYDLTFSIDPSALGYANRHSMTINGKHDGLTARDFQEVAARNDISDHHSLITPVQDSLTRFAAYAKEVGIQPGYIDQISKIIGG